MKNAELNGVWARVYPVGIVKPGQFDGYLKANVSLLVMDCEGAEFNLLDPANPILLQTNILVEIHKEFGDKREIIRKCAGTHGISEISPSVRKAREIPVGPFQGIDVLRASDEWRGLQTSWLFIEVNSK